MSDITQDTLSLRAARAYSRIQAPQGCSLREGAGRPGKMNFEYNEAYGRFTDIALGGGVD